MDWLVRQQKDCRVTDVAQAFKLPRSGAHRTLQTLLACGWVVQNPQTSAYRPSLKVFELGVLVEGMTDLKSQLHPCLAKLAAASGETIHLSVLDGSEIVYLDKFDSPLPVAAYSRIGGRAAAYCVASGKALLAALDEDAASLKQRIGRLVAATPNTIMAFDQLEHELAKVRERGYAENREEWRIGVCGIGAVVFNAGGQAVAAIGMSVPSIRFARSHSRALIEKLLECAKQASELMGYRPPLIRRRQP